MSVLSFLAQQAIPGDWIQNGTGLSGVRDKALMAVFSIKYPAPSIASQQQETQDSVLGVLGEGQPPWWA